jgi:hypothetical protein
MKAELPIRVPHFDRLFSSTHTRYVSEMLMPNKHVIDSIQPTVDKPHLDSMGSLNTCH